MTNPSETRDSELVAKLNAAERWCMQFDKRGVGETMAAIAEARDTIDRLTSTGEAVGVMVKPLQWTGDKATTPFGVYAVARTPDGYQASLGCDELCHVGFNAGGAFESAKDAAKHHVEEHYTNAILSAISPREGHVEVPVESEMRTLAEHCAGLMNKLSNRGHTGLMQECPLCQAYIGAARLLAHETDTPMPGEVVMWDRRLQAAALPHNQGETKP